MIADCDVLQTDRGARTASITDNRVAAACTSPGLFDEGWVLSSVPKPPAVDGQVRLDPGRAEDRGAGVAHSLAMADGGLEPSRGALT